MAYCTHCHQYTSCSPCDCGCSQSSDTGCPIQLDFSCVIYHKDNNEVTELDGLALTNGATLELVIETIDEKIKQLNVPDWDLAFLDGIYTINNLTQFGEAVNVQFEQVDTDITALTALVNLPITPVDSESINLTTSGVNNHTIEADLIVSPTSDNQLSVLPDGAYVAPQTLSINYSTKDLSISDGNTVNLAGMFTNYLGEVASDPSSPANGQYWWRTDTLALRIRVNSTTVTITTT